MDVGTRVRIVKGWGTFNGLLGTVVDDRKGIFAVQIDGWGERHDAYCGDAGLLCVRSEVEVVVEEIAS